MIFRPTDSQQDPLSQLSKEYGKLFGKMAPIISLLLRCTCCVSHQEVESVSTLFETWAGLVICFDKESSSETMPCQFWALSESLKKPVRFHFHSLRALSYQVKSLTTLLERVAQPAFYHSGLSSLSSLGARHGNVRLSGIPQVQSRSSPSTLL